MAPTPASIAIAGVTGTLGLLIAQTLLETTDTTVHGLCRSPEKVVKLLADYPSRLKIFPVSVLDLEEVRKGVAGCQTVVCTYNRMETALFIDSQKVLIEACDAEGIDRFVASDYTLDYRTLEIGELPPKDAQVAIWRYLRDGNKDGTIKVRGVHILVGGFVEAFFWGFFKPEDPRFWGTGKETWDLITYEDTAKYTAKVAMDPEAPTGFLKFRDFRTDINEVAAAIGKKRNSPPLPLLPQGTLAEAGEKIKAAQAAGRPWLEDLVVYVQYYFQITAFQLGDQLDNHRYPDIKTITLEDAVEKFVI